MSRQWRVSENGKQSGPFEREEIQRRFDEGALTAAAHVWSEGFENWAPIGDFFTPSPSTPEPSPSADLVLRGQHPDALAHAAGPNTATDNRYIREGWSPGIVQAFYWMYQQKQWPLRLLMLMGVLVVPLLGLLFARGWRVDVVRRMATREENLLPSPYHAGRFLVDGLILWSMTLLYWLPLVIFLAVFGYSWLEFFWNLAAFVVGTILGWEGTGTFMDVIGSIGFPMALSGAISMAWFLSMWTVYRIAMVRYAVTRRVGCFFQIWTNLRLAARSLDALLLIILLTWPLAWGLSTIFVTLAPFLAVTAIGPFLLHSFLLSVLYSATAFWYGRLAQRIGAGEEAVVQPAPIPSSLLLPPD